MAWIIRLPLERPTFQQLVPPGSLPLMCLIGWAALSIFNARFPLYSVFMLVSLCKSVLWFLYLAAHVKTREDIRTIVICLSIGLLLETVFAAAQHVAGSPLGLDFFGERTKMKEVELAASQVFRVGGTLGHPNSLGGYVAGALPVVMALSLSEVPKRLRLLAIAASAGGTLTLILTYSRSAWLAGLLSFAVLVGWLLSNRQTRRRVVPIAVVAAVLCTVMAGFAPLIKARWTEDDDGSTTSRFSQFRMAGQMIEQHPWLGVGLNHYPALVHLYETYVEDDKPGMVYEHTGRVHNVFLLTIAESGIPMVLWLGLFLLTATWRGWRAITRSKDELLRFTLFGMILGLYAKLLHDAFHTGNLAINPFLWVFTAILIAGERIAVREAAAAK
jgi:O-antigen ligase